MKKILFYIDSLNKGGLDKVVLDLLNNMDYEKYDITLMRRFPGGYYSELLNPCVHKKANMPFKATISKQYNHIVRVLCDRLPRKLVYRMFVHKKYDVEVACGDAFAATLVGGSTNKQSKKILWEHMDVTKDESTATHFNEEQVKRFFNPFDKIVGVSKDCQKKFEEKYGFQDRSMYIYNPIDVEDIVNKANEKAVEFDKNCFNVLAIGRFMPQKAFDRLVDVAGKIIKEGIDFNLYIIGEGPEQEKVQKLIDKNGLENHIRLLGFKENPYPYIKAADLIICSSIHESYCLVVAESLVIGTPVISTMCTGPIELLDEGRYGMLVENSEKGIYEGLKELITHPEKLQHYQKQAVLRRDFFDVHTCVKEWEKLLDS